MSRHEFRAVREFSNVLLAGLLGGWIVGSAFALGTFFLFGIGAVFGFPLGVYVGMRWAANHPPMDTVFVLTVSLWTGFILRATLLKPGIDSWISLESQLSFLIPSLVAGIVATTVHRLSNGLKKPVAEIGLAGLLIVIGVLTFTSHP